MSKESYLASRMLAHRPLPPAQSRNTVRPDRVDVILAKLDEIQNSLRGVTLRRGEVEAVYAQIEQLKEEAYQCCRPPSQFDPMYRFPPSDDF